MTVSELSFSRPVSQTASWLTGHSFCHLGSPGSRHAAVTHLSPGARGARPIDAFNQNRKRGSASHCSIRTDIIPAEWKLLTCRHHWSVVKCLAERFGLQVLFFIIGSGGREKPTAAFISDSINLLNTQSKYIRDPCFACAVIRDIALKWHNSDYSVKSYIYHQKL